MVITVCIQDRWKSCDLNNFQFLDGFVGFSGGLHQCPGRYVPRIVKSKVSDMHNLGEK